MTNGEKIKEIFPSQHSDEEIAKQFIEDVEAVKDLLPCFCEQMDFPNTFDEFADYYGFKDTEEVYTNGNDLIQVFRVKQWLEHISTTKNDLGVALISREQAKEAIRDKFKDLPSRVEINTILNELPSVTPQEPKTGRWMLRNSFLVPYKCSECNYKSERYDNYCPNCGAKMVEPQESEE